MSVIDISEKTAEWVKNQCSNCGNPHPIYKVFFRGKQIIDLNGEANYCPKCGAKMK